MMGNGIDFNNLDDGPKQCFNAAKSYQVGWYDLQKASIDPLDFVGNPRSYVMNGVADYKKDRSSKGELVSLLLVNSGNTKGGVDYYIGYNRAIGANSGTVEIPNTVTLLEKDKGPYTYGTSRRLAAMTVGESTQIPSYGGTSLNVFVTVDSIDNDGKDATITISTTAAVIIDPSNTNPTNSPTSSQIRSPQQCVDDVDFRWKGSKKKKKDCRFVGKGNNKKKMAAKSNESHLVITDAILPREPSKPPSYCPNKLAIFRFRVD